MWNKLMAALLVAVTAGAASAQVAGSSGNGPNGLQSSPATADVATSPGSLTNSVQAGPVINESASSGLGPMIGEPHGRSMKPAPSDRMAVDGAEGWSFEDLEGVQVQRDILFRKLDLLVRADTRSSPVYFGVDREIRFVEHHDYQPGIPAPIGISYRRGHQRWAFFAELTPILEVAPTTPLGWGGGVGIRFYFGR